jgi:serine/threonine protein kinase
MIIVYGVARGMAFLHGLKILHRDLKPENVFLDENGYPRIADLGFAKYSESKRQTVQTGTPLYLAPEVWCGLYYGFPADVYSYAMLFYEVIEGKPPMLKNVRTQAQQKAAVCDKGQRPMLTLLTTPQQQELLNLMWAPGADSRPTFEEIATTLEDEAYWCAKTDRDAFLKYKAYLDQAEAESTESIIPPVWVRQATRFVSIIKELGALKNTTAMVVRLLTYLTTESEESGVNQEAKATLTQLLQTSFSQHNRLEASLFTDFARQFLAGTNQKRRRVWESNPLMDAVINVADLEVEATAVAKGAIGDVFRGKRLANGSLVAVKRLTPTTGPHICSIYREVITMLYCRHPCVLPLVGWNLVTRKQIIVVSEWMQNLPVNVQANYTPTQKTIIIYGAARALLWLHNRGVVHGNIRPSNIFLDASRRPRLGGLGAASGAASFADDVMALALTFWEIIAGVQSGIDPAALQQGSRPPRRSLAVSHTLRSLIQSMWEPDPAKRPKIADIVERLALPKLWVTGTEELPFQQYKTFVDQQQADVQRSKQADNDAWQAALEVVTRVDALSQRLEADADVAAKAVHAIAILFGKGGEENAQLRQDLTAALKGSDSFVKEADRAIDGLDPRLENEDGEGE